MSNWQQQPPQQWNTAPQGGFVGQPQQGQGWGQGAGQWHQAPPQGQGFFNPQQQQQFPVHQGQLHHQPFPQNQAGGRGFMTGSVGGYVGGFQPGGGGVPPGRTGGVGQQQFSGFPQQQRQLQAMQQQQQQQMAYIQEQQRLAREEQKKREMEIQKRKLMNINVANPTSSSLSFDDLVNLKPSSSPKPSPKVNRQGQSSTTPTVGSTITSSQQHEHEHIPSSIDDPLPTQSAPTQAAVTSQLVTATPTTASCDQSNSTPPAAQSGNTFEKLMESSLSNLKDISPGRSRKMDFKSSATSGSKASPLLAGSQRQNTFSESTRARAWTAEGGDFSGIFAEHASTQQPPPTQAAGASLEGDDSFGDFQSVGVVGGAGGGVRGRASSDILMSQADNQLIGGVQGFQPTQPGFQGQSLISGGVPQQSTRTRGSSVHGVGGGGGNTVSTSSYQHPISSTSESPKPLSPTHFSSLDPSKFPPLYTTVFERCSKPGEPYMITELLFPLLMSSQLPKNVLRDLWSLANRAVPGKLNQTELYVLLGLIGLAQSGNPSPTPEDLKKAPELPIPKLSALKEETVPTTSTSSQSLSSSQIPAPLSALPPPADDFGDFQQGQQSSFQPSFPTVKAPPTIQPLLPLTVAAGDPSSYSATQQHTGGGSGGNDKYNVFDELKSTGSGLLGQTLPPSDTTMSTGSGLLGQTLPPSDTTGVLPASSGTSQPQGKPPSEDKYSVFDDLRSTSSDDVISIASSDNTASSAVGGLAPPQGLLPLATANTASTAGVQQVLIGVVSLSSLLPTATATLTTAAVKSHDFGSFSSAPLSSSSASASTSKQTKEGFLPFSSISSTSNSSGVGGFADFASFQSQSAPASSVGEGLGPSATDADNSNQGWAAFTDFTSSSQPQGPSSDQNVLFPSALVSAAPSKDTSISTTTTSTAVAKSKAESAFGSLLPAELCLAVTSSTAPAESRSLLGSLDSKPAVTGAVTVEGGGGGGLDFAMFESDQPSPESKKKEKAIKKQLTGLEVLEEEFSARVSAKAASSSTAPVGGSIMEPLVPDSAPLDEFGDFEAYSSPSREGKRSGLLLAEGGESPPNLKKSSTDPLKVWRICLSKCSEVLESCASVFADVKEESILEEITLSEEGRNKLKGIVEVYRLAKRVYRPFREKKEGAKEESCVLAIQKQWKGIVNVLPNNVMSQLYSETSPASVEEEDVLSDSISKCSLCLTSKNVSISPHLSLDGKREDYTLPLLFHSGQSYHPSCANFWINVVQDELPVLT